MKNIIAPIDRELLEKELTEDKFLRKTNKKDNDIYIVTAFNSPNLMLEIGRLRELSFRMAGGGTGKEYDVDKFDYSDNPYKQLIVWDPRDKEIVGGYRYLNCSDAAIKSKYRKYLATYRLFRFSKKFKKNYLPYTIELGRSFVQPKYQSTTENKTKGIFALDNLWDGLGALIVDNPQIKYFFGKVTMYPKFDKNARNHLLNFINKYFYDNDHLLKIRRVFRLKTNLKKIKNIYHGKSFLEDYKILSKKTKELGERVPPLFSSYLSLSSTLKSFGTAINPKFGNVEETAILITIKDIYSNKAERHIKTYKKKENNE